MHSISSITFLPEEQSDFPWLKIYFYILNEKTIIQVYLDLITRIFYALWLSTVSIVKWLTCWA